MDPLAQKQPPTTYQPPTPQPTPFQVPQMQTAGQATQTQQTQPQPSTPNPAAQQSQSNLRVPFVSPTHFDRQRFAKLNVGVPTQILRPETIELENLRADLKHKKVINIVFLAFMIVFFVAAVMGFVLYLTTDDNISSVKADLENKNAIVAALEETSGVTGITSPEQVPTYTTTHGYIYLDSWHIKIEVPKTLDYVSYRLDEKFRPKICFNASEAGLQSFPAFADVDQNPGGMGCLTRVSTEEGATDKDTGISFGEQVLTYEDYSYFYTGPATTFSQAPAEQERETSVVKKIKSMLTKGVSIYE